MFFTDFGHYTKNDFQKSELYQPKPFAQLVSLLSLRPSIWVFLLVSNPQLHINAIFLAYFSSGDIFPTDSISKSLKKEGYPSFTFFEFPCSSNAWRDRSPAWVELMSI